MYLQKVLEESIGQDDFGFNIIPGGSVAKDTAVEGSDVDIYIHVKKL
jgi:predicted nucleotidyltransferase